MPQEDHSFFVVDNFVAVKTGEPYRLLPFGTIVRGGNKYTITPEMAKTFKLPPWKPPIKLGSHKEDAPAGGHIVKLDVREDGLYAFPEYVPNGEKAMLEGAYRYHSPEIIWGDKGIEDISTGQLLPGPFIVGDALVHDPALGESAALYTYKSEAIGGNMGEEQKAPVIPANVLEKIVTFFSGHEKVEDIPTKDQLEAVAKERDEFKSKLDQLETEKKAAELKDKLSAEVKAEKYSGIPADSVEVLYGMTDAQREWTLKTIAAFVAQVNESKIGSEIGSTGDGLENISLDAAIRAYAAEKKITYPDAMNALRQEKPELFTAKR